MPPITRTWRGALTDWLAGWYWGLPCESGAYTAEHVQIPLGDGVESVANLYRPVNGEPIGTLLCRSPYGIDGMIAVGYATIYAARGYQVLMASCRGTSGSGGEYYPFHEAADGIAVVAWMRDQPWYTGSFATVGASYLGYTQLAILTDPPADMKAAVIQVAPHDYSKLIWGTGALNSDFFSWCELMAALKRGDRVSLPTSISAPLRSVIESPRLLDAVDKYLKGDAQRWIKDMVTHPDVTDPYWAPMNSSAALDRASIPILLLTGWYDIALGQVMEQYARLAARGCTVAMTVGPWSHTEVAANSKAEPLAWLDEHFAARAGQRRPSLLRIFVTGAREWRQFSSWPPATVAHMLYLGPGGSLAEVKPLAEDPDSVFEFDPADPTPSIGMSMYTRLGGAKDDDSALAARPDVLAFTTQPLDRDIEVCGKPSVELQHSTNLPYGDLFVRLCEVDSRGRSHNIAEAYLRLSITRGPQLQLDLLDCAHRFRKGFRVRVVIAGGSHPRYIRNLGTGENHITGSAMRSVVHTVRHCAAAVSRIVLPVV